MCKVVYYPGMPPYVCTGVYYPGIPTRVYLKGKRGRHTHQGVPLRVCTAGYTTRVYFRVCTTVYTTRVYLRVKPLGILRLFPVKPLEILRLFPLINPGLYLPG